MRSSDTLLRALALVIAVGLLVVVRGERRVTVGFTVPVAARLPAALLPATPLPADVSVSLSGPWSRLRDVDANDLGPAVVDLARAGPGVATWSVRPEALHLPHGVRVESIYPAQGTVELRYRVGEAIAPPPTVADDPQVR